MRIIDNLDNLICLFKVTIRTLIIVLAVVVSLSVFCHNKRTFNSPGSHILSIFNTLQHYQEDVVKDNMNQICNPRPPNEA